MDDTTEEIPLTDDYLAGVMKVRRLSPEMWDNALQIFEDLYRAHAPQLLLFLSARLAESDVESAHLHVWQHVWQQGPPHAVGSDYREWLQELAQREIEVTQRNKRRLRGKDTDDVPTTQQTSIADKTRMDLMKFCMNSLDEDLADVTRRRLSGQSFKQIAAKLGLDVAQVEEMFERSKALSSVYSQRASIGT